MGQTGRGPLRILYVDDHEVSRLVADHLLVSMGCRVCAVGSAREALMRLGESAFDMLLTDIHMPEMDGTALLGAVRARHSAAELPAVAVTADVMGRSGPGFRELGFDGVVAKPLLVEALERVLAEVAAPASMRTFVAMGMAEAC
jgi:CheY-like chemotaxis protein